MNDYDDFELPNVNHDSLGKIVELTDRIELNRAHIVHLEEQLKDAKRLEVQLSQKDLPTLFDDVGISSLGLPDGRVVQISEFVSGSIPKSQWPEAEKWLIKNGFEDLIKGQLTVNTGRNELEILAAIKDVLIETFKIEPEITRTVHPQTLGAWAREQLTKGELEIPFKLLGIHVGRKTTIKS